jgi:hypothetical protein
MWKEAVMAEFLPVNTTEHKDLSRSGFSSYAEVN